MKKAISVCFEFKGVGHANISIFPSGDCSPYLQQISGCKDLLLEYGDYLMRATGVVSISGATIKVLDQGTELGALELPEGFFSRPINFSVK